MDNNRFDDIIRKKAEGYQDTGHDAQALTGFRKKLTALPVKNRASGLNTTGYLLGAMALFTLINFGIVWYFSEGRYNTLNEEVSRLKSQRNQLAGSMGNRAQIQEPRPPRVDTVYIYRDIQVSASIKETRDDLGHNSNQHYASLDRDNELSSDLKAFLSENNLLLEGEGGELMLVVNNTPVSPVNKPSLHGNYYGDVPGRPEYLPKVAVYEQPRTPPKPQEKQKSSQVQWALEKHNHRGIDFQFGIEGKYQISNFDLGVGERNSGVGFMTEVILSPTWRLETGLHFGVRAYKISEDEIIAIPASILDDYPGYKPELGELSSLESEAEVVQVPFNLKHFAPLGYNKRWYLSAGITPQWSKSQEFDYKYTLQLPEPPEPEEFVSFVGSKQEVEGGYYTTTLNLGLGTELYLDRRLRWQLGLFYQKGLGDAGYEKRQLKSSFGIKSSLWFNKP